MSGDEKLAALAASDPDGFKRLAATAGSALDAISLARFDRGKLHSDGTRSGGTVAVGTVIMFPTNPRFRWHSDGITGNWVILEVVSISPANNAKSADDEVFTLAVVGHTSAAQSETGCFTRPPPARIITSALPQWLVHPIDAEGLREARLAAEDDARRRTGGNKRGPAAPTPGTYPSPLFPAPRTATATATKQGAKLFWMTTVSKEFSARPRCRRSSRPCATVGGR